MNTCHRAQIAIILASCILVSMNGCGGSAPDSGANVIRFWHFWSEPGQKAVLKELVAEFEKEKNVKVELTELSWNDGKVKLQAAFNSGAPPDVIELGSDWIAQFSSSGVLLALPGDGNALGRFVSYSVAPAMWQGRTFAYPWTLDTRVIFTNQTLLAKAGWTEPIITMDQLIRAAELVKESGTDGWGANGADAHRLYKKILPFMWTYGGDVFDAQGKPILNSPENVQALSVYAQLARAGFVETQRQLDAAFVQGKIALWNSGSWLSKKIYANKALKAQPIMMPGVHGQPGVSFAGGEYLAVSASTKNTQHARDLVLFLTKGSTAVRFCAQISEAGFPAEKASFSDSVLIADPIKALFARQLQHARMTPVHPRWLDIEAVIEDAVVRVLLGEETPQESMEKAQQAALQIVGG